MQNLPKLNLENIYTYHAPNPGQVVKYETIRNKAKELALLFEQLCPPSRERSTAFTRLEDAVMHANASIARNPPTKDEIEISKFIKLLCAHCRPCLQDYDMSKPADRVACFKMLCRKCREKLIDQKDKLICTYCGENLPPRMSTEPAHRTGYFKICEKCRKERDQFKV